VQHHIGAAVGGRFDEVLCRYVGTTGDLGQTLDGKTGVLGRSVQTGTDGGGAQVHFQQQLLATLDGFDLFTQGDGEGVELLTQGHGHGVLQLGTAHFQDMFEFLGLTSKAAMSASRACRVVSVLLTTATRKPVG
jgi:hypothetical protein